jgi:hypothetical protein
MPDTSRSGVAPIPVWSSNIAGAGATTGATARAGHRRLQPDALRCGKRRLVRPVFHHRHTGHRIHKQPCQPAAA